MNAIEAFSGTASLNKFNMRSEIVGGGKTKTLFLPFHGGLQVT